MLKPLEVRTPTVVSVCYSSLYVGQDVHRQLCGLVSGTNLGEILLSVQDGGECEELYRRYLHDFVRSVHKCPHKTEATVKLEYQVLYLI